MLGWRDHATKLLEKIENREEVSEDLISLPESAFFISYLDVGTYDSKIEEIYLTVC